MGVVIGILWFVTGMHWAFVLGYLLMAIVADFVAGAGKYRSKKLNSLAYILFSLGSTGTYILFFVDPNGWAQTMLGNGTLFKHISVSFNRVLTGFSISFLCAFCLGMLAALKKVPSWVASCSKSSLKKQASQHERPASEAGALA